MTALTRRLTRLRPPARRLLLALATFAAVLLLTGASQAAAPTWQAPLAPMRVTRPFQPPPTPYAPGHRGVDLAGRPGDPVRAPVSGRVAFAGELAGRGVVVVTSGELRTTLEPVRATVSRGTAVTGGQLVGALEVGHAGCPADACLHWGVLRGERYLDPLGFLAPRTVRLLPPSGMAVQSPSAVFLPLLGSMVTVGMQRPGPATAEVAGGVPLTTTAGWSLAAVAGLGVLLAHRRR